MNEDSHQFGKYLLIDPIDGGGMSEVWRAKPLDADAIVAVKRLLPHMAEDPTFVAMFINEARIAVQLAHPNIAQIFDLGRVGPNFYIAMEYVPGQDLRAVAAAGRRGEAMPIPLVAMVGAQLCDALDYAHRRADAKGVSLGIVHRDVAPDNCLVTFDGGVKLIDFGIAKLPSHGPRTQVGTIKGKYAYMSPEQALAGPLDRRSDLFSLSIVLYELVTGRRLFKCDSDLRTLMAVTEGAITPPRKHNPNVPRALEKILLRGLQRDPALRYQWASEMGDALRAFLADLRPAPNRAQLKRYLSVAFADERDRESRRRKSWAARKAAGLQSGDSLEDNWPASQPTLRDESLAEVPGAPLPEMAIPDPSLAPPEELPAPLPTLTTDLGRALSLPGVTLESIAPLLTAEESPPSLDEHELTVARPALPIPDPDMVEIQLRTAEIVSPFRQGLPITDLRALSSLVHPPPTPTDPRLTPVTASSSPAPIPEYEDVDLGSLAVVSPLKRPLAIAPGHDEPALKTETALAPFIDLAPAPKRVRKTLAVDPVAPAHRRFKVSLAISGRWLKAKPQDLSAIMVSLSQGEAELLTATHVPERETVELTLPVGKATIAVRGEVFWSRRVGRQQALGVRFAQLHPEIEEQLAKALPAGPR